MGTALAVMMTCGARKDFGQTDRQVCENSKMNRILLVKTTSMGDVIHALPVVADLMARWPQLQIDWVVEETFADIPSLHPQVATVYTVAVRRWRKDWWRPQTWREIRAVKRLLAATPYDAVIDLQGLLKSACIGRCADGPLHGYAADSIREPLASMFYAHRYAVTYQQHAVQRMRALVAQVCGTPMPETPPEYGVSPASGKPWQARPLSNMRDKKEQAESHAWPVPPHASMPPFAALHASSRDSKCWPETHWVALGQALADVGYGMRLPWATAAEHARATRIAAQVPGAQVFAKLPLQALATELAQVCFAVGVDTGLSHLTTALGVPTVAIYCDTDPALTGVLPGVAAPAINLGGPQQCPSVAAVIAALAGMGVKLYEDASHT